MITYEKVYSLYSRKSTPGNNLAFPRISSIRSSALAKQTCPSAFVAWEKVKVSQTSQSCPSALTSTNQCRLCHIALLYPVNPYALHCSTLTSSWLWILAVKTYIRLSQHIYCTDVHISKFGPCAEDYDIADIVTVHCCNEQSRHVKASNPNSFQCKGQTYVHWFQKFAIGMFCKKVM